MLQASIPTKFNIPFGNAASAPYIRPVPQASQISIQAGAASLTDGFPPVCFLPIGAGGTPFWGADVNGIVNQVSAWSRWQAAGGPVPYDGTFSTGIGGYPNGAIVASVTLSGYAWLSTVDNNVVNPDTGTPQSPASGWAPIALLGGSLTTGAWTWRPTSEVIPGWTIANATTIGDASSGASQLADPSAANQFAWLWAKFSNTQCPVSGGRGASAAADFAAHKTIQVLDLRGTQGGLGVDTMGGGSTTRLTGVPVNSGAAVTPGSSLGENLHVLVSGENGVHSHGVADPTHSHSTNASSSPTTAGVSAVLVPQFNGATGAAATGISINNSAGGAGHNTVGLAMTGYHYFKL